MPYHQRLALLSLASLLLGLGALAQTNVVQQAKGSLRDDPAGLPPWLLPVPAGNVWIGSTSDKLIETCAEAGGQDLKRMDPSDPNFQRALRQTASELGRVRVPVSAFYLARSPVTNRQYLQFVQKSKVRFPFHWWRWGRPDDYVKRLEDINKEFPNERELAPVMYWEKHWQDLPYELKDDGKSIDELPVVFVTWRDAVQYCAWIGMRLPSELEWTRAARGDGEQVWLWGPQAGDHYSERILEQLQLKNYRDRVLKAVGTVPLETGPYGHTDMVAQVWQWTSNTGFRPLTGHDLFAKELKKLNQSKHGTAIGPPVWDDGNKAVVKGGSYLGFDKDAIIFHIDARIAVGTGEAVQSAGFRVAKSPKPGYDMLFSLLRSGALNQRNINLDDQVGIESYKLDKDNFPESYQTVSFAPVAFLSKDKVDAVQKLQDATLVEPMLIGCMVFTGKAAEPALEGSAFNVYYRHKGMPKDLQEAIKAGAKSMQAHRERGPDEKPEEWRTVIAKYGIDAKELEDKKAVENIKFVRIEGVEVPTEECCLLLRDNSGAVKGRIPLPRQEKLDATSTQAASTLACDKLNDKERVTVKVSVPLDTQKTSRRFLEFTVPLVLDQAPGASGTWRLPANQSVSSSSATTQQESAKGK
jgi:sulfatase modifying factor 1